MKQKQSQSKQSRKLRGRGNRLPQLVIYGGKALKKNCRCTNIKDMGALPTTGKKSSQIAKEYGVTRGRVNQYAKEHDFPFVSFDGGKTVEHYLFDEAAEEQFANRRKESPGAPVRVPPKVRGKPGRPRKEKPVDNTPKRPVGRPRKDEKLSRAVPKKQKTKPKKK